MHNTRAMEPADLNGMQPSLISAFPALKSQNVCCGKGLLRNAAHLSREQGDVQEVQCYQRDTVKLISAQQCRAGTKLLERD